MGIFMSILDFIIDNILINASMVLGLVALIGLVLQRKSVSQCISGTFKTMMGFMILSAGSSVIVGSLENFSTWFSAGLGIDGAVASIEAVLAVAMQESTIGRDIALVYAGIFVVNILIARFTKLKYVFLNGEAPIYMAMISILFGVGLCKLGHIPAVILGSILGGICCVIFPAMAQPFVRKITGSDDIALGHFCTLGYILSAFVSKVTGDPSKSTEDTKISTKLSFLQDTYLAVGSVMIPLYILMAILAGPEVVAEASGGKNYIVFAIMQGITFCVGLFILLTGVRLLIAELVPAFAGIAKKIVPRRPARIGLPGSVYLCAKCNCIRLYFHHCRYDYRYVPVAAVRPADGYPWYYEQFLCRRHGRYLCKRHRRPARYHYRKHCARPVYFPAAGPRCAVSGADRR